MTSFPSLITAPLPPANGSSIGESLHHPAFQGMPWKAGHHENWGIFNRRFWGVYVRHSHQPALADRPLSENSSFRRSTEWEQRNFGPPSLTRRSSTPSAHAALWPGRRFCPGMSLERNTAQVQGSRPLKSERVTPTPI